VPRSILCEFPFIDKHVKPFLGFIIAQATFHTQNATGRIAVSRQKCLYFLPQFFGRVAGRQRGKARLDKADLPPHLAQQRHLGSEVDAAQADVLASQLAVGIL